MPPRKAQRPAGTLGSAPAQGAQVPNNVLEIPILKARYTIVIMLIIVIILVIPIKIKVISKVTAIIMMKK